MITRIELTNFKCFENESFDIAPLTLFCGVNGMGKSSVIQSLLLLKQSHESGILLAKNEVILDNYSFTDLETAENLCRVNASPKEVTIKIEHCCDNTYVWQIDASDPDGVQLPVIIPDKEGWQAMNLFKKEFIYLNAERYGPRKIYLRNDKRVFNTRLGVQGELTPIFIFDALKNNLEIGSSGVMFPGLDNSDFYQNLNAWLAEILGRSVVTRVESSNKDDVKLGFTMRGKNGGKFSALQVGFGYSFSLPVIAAALSAKPGDLIIIENPEAHLHPAAQSKMGILLSLVANSGVQVLVETHSDHFMNGIRVMAKGDKKFGQIQADLLKIHFFHEDFDGDGKVVHAKRTLKTEDDGSLNGWPTGFFDEWERNLQKLMF
jgi:predicted ATPase